MLRVLPTRLVIAFAWFATVCNPAAGAEDIVVPAPRPIAPLQEPPAPTVEAPPPARVPVVPVPRTLKEAVKGEVKALRRGPLLIHGNYCGVGNRPGTEPIDPLDAACMRHDACTQTGKMPSCACDNRLREEAAAIAHDPQAPLDIQALAAAMAASMVILICK